MLFRNGKSSVRSVLFRVSIPIRMLLPPPTFRMEKPRWYTER